MSAQVLQQAEAVELQPLISRISALPDESLLKLANYVEELIEELEEAEDIAAIDARKDEPTVSFESVLAKHEAEVTVQTQGPKTDFNELRA